MIELSREYVQACENGAIRAQQILLHDGLVFDAVTDVDVRRKLDVEDRGVQVDVIRLFALLRKELDESLLSQLFLRTYLGESCLS